MIMCSFHRRITSFMKLIKSVSDYPMQTITFANINYFFYFNNININIIISAETNQTMTKQNNIKQCVLICQSITHDFESASAFAKIGNTSMIELCVGWLIDNGIKEIFMFYSKCKTDVEQFCNNFPTVYGKNDVKIHLNYMKPEDLRNFGDVMREVQFRNIISQDFLILFADTVSNLDLSKAISMHFKKKAELKSVVLTTVLRECSFDRKIHITNSETGEILQMEEDNSDKFTLNQERINLKKMNVEFRRDLTHCDIYLCTVDVFKSFKETYEYATMFDFINGMLTSEVYQEKIVGHILQNHEHTFRTNKAKDYYLAYMHYISNHFAPYTLTGRSRFSRKGEDQKFVIKNFNKVIFNGVSISRTAYLSDSCYVGQKCQIGINCEVQKSILEKGVNIAKGTTLKNCLILQGCTLGEKSKFEYCLIEKVNQTQQIRRFKLFEKQQMQITTEPLFQSTPPPQESTFEEELEQMLSEQPELQIVGELNSIRKHHNKSLQQFTKQMIKTLNPQNTEGMTSFAMNWGEILLKIHENQKLLIDSLYYSCKNISKYEFAFHAFLQYFFKFEWIKDFTIIQWYDQMVQKFADEQSMKTENKTLSLCSNFVKVLKQRADDSDSSSSSSSSEKEDKNKESSSSSQNQA